MNAPLAGLLVVSLEHAVAAPFCTARLADAGARVIKIERPEGDLARRYDEATIGGSSYFVWCNRGKESVVLDLREEVSREQLRKLIARADILVQNLKPGALLRLGVLPDQQARDEQGLICCSITGYGDSGPLAARKAYDLLIQAESGLASVTGSSEPARVGISIVDIATGATAYGAILEALIRRSRTGEGADLRISMFDVMAEWLTVPLLNSEAGRPAQRVGLAHPSIAPYGLFSTADNRQILMGLQNEREWQAFCIKVLASPEVLEDARFSSNVARVANRKATDDLVARTFSQLTREEAIARLSAADIAYAEINDMTALSRHPHLRRITVPTAGGPVSFPSPPVIEADKPRRYGKVPALGEHTQRVLAEIEPTSPG